jgi:hypothetical protein
MTQRDKQYIDDLLARIEANDIEEHAHLLAKDPQWSDPDYFGKNVKQAYKGGMTALRSHVEAIRTKVKNYSLAEFYVRKLFRRALRARDRVALSEAFDDLIPTQEGVLFMYSFILDGSFLSKQMVYEMLNWPQNQPGDDYTYENIMRHYVRAVANQIDDPYMVRHFDTHQNGSLEYNRMGPYYNEIRDMARAERAEAKAQAKVKTESKSVRRTPNRSARQRSPPMYRSPVVRKCSGQRKIACRSPCVWVVGKGCRSPYYNG